MATSSETQEFWRDIETRLGVVVERTLARHKDGPGADPGLWGLIFFTHSEFHFRHMPGGNWYAEMVKRNAGKKGKEVTYAITLADIREIIPPRKRNPIVRLLLGADGVFSLVLDNERTVVLELVDGATPFVERLVQTWQAARASSE